MKSNIFGESKKDTENLVEFEFDNIIINLDLENCKSSKEELLEKIVEVSVFSYLDLITF